MADLDFHLLQSDHMQKEYPFHQASPYNKNEILDLGGGDPNKYLDATDGYKGLILLSCGPYYNVLRILVPLTIEDAQIRQGLEIISQCFDEAKQ